MAIRGGSGHETAVAAYITDKLKAAGARPADIRHDRAHLRTRIKGEVGNLIFTLAGTARAPRRLLMAHMDTVPICIGSQPKRPETSSAPPIPPPVWAPTIARAARWILSAAIEILGRGLPHPPLTFFWPIQEEVGLYGARYAVLKLLGNPKLGFNWDGGAAEKVTIGATGGYRMDIEVDRLASHAGAAPEKGISAIAIASLAIADLARGGWHGLVTRGNCAARATWASSAAATPPMSSPTESSSRPRPAATDPEFRGRIINGHREGVPRRREGGEKRRRKTRPRDFDGHLDYEAFRLADDELCVSRSRGGAPRPWPRTRARGQQRRPGRQLDDRPRNPHRDARLRPDERSHHERAARHQGIRARLPRRPATGNAILARRVGQAAAAPAHQRSCTSGQSKPLGWQRRRVGQGRRDRRPTMRLVCHTHSPHSGSSHPGTDLFHPNERRTPRRYESME